MGDSPVDLSALSALSNASEARRRARHRLRTTAAAVAEAIIDDLRVGDVASINVGGERVIYVVEQVTWRAWVKDEGEDPDDASLDWSEARGVTLTRHGSDEPCALLDCRRAYVDEDGTSYKPAARELFALEAEGQPSHVWEDHRRHLATDDELQTFIVEAALLADAFARRLESEATEINARIDEMLAPSAES